MCGIAGVWSVGAAGEDLTGLVTQMGHAIEHRGPDDKGTWTDTQAGVCLGHRRLAIVDLSESGRQPMKSASGRFTISFNGEIYNFKALRTELVALGHLFHGQSDTEVMLAAFEQWGLKAVARFVGMFAFALWDRESQQLHLIRDRLGKKPIFFARRGATFAFASELKALRLAVDALEVDRDSLAQYLRLQYVPAPRSIFKDVHKVNPGTITTVRRADLGFDITHGAYWSAEQVYADAARDMFKGSREEAISELELLLKDSIRLRMISDVPLGAFLSGGIDSSIVVALMQSQSSRPVRTFTIGFGEDAFDESKFALEVAKYLKTDHTELKVTPAMALAVVPKLPRIYDEPFGDSSQIPTFLVSELARQHVTVALSGDGGDELFCGYNRYIWWRQLWPMLGSIPYPMRAGIARWALKYDSGAWDRVMGPMMRLLPRSRRRVASGMLIRKAAETMLAANAQELYLRLVSHWRDPNAIVIGAQEPATVLNDSWPRGIEAGTLRMSLLDILTYLPDDILVKMDRASMATSLEARCPLLDHRVVEFAARLPLDFKIADGKGKAILRSLLYKHVPRALVDRPKTGFGIPLAEWLRGPLREWGEALVAADRLRREGLLNVEAVRTAWEQFQQNRADLHYQLWTLLMFQAWLDEWR